MLASCLLALVVVAAPAQGVDPLEQVITQVAIDFVPTHLRGTNYPDTFGLEPDAYAIAATTIGGEEAIAKQHIESLYSSVIASEMLSSYEAKAKGPIQLGSEFESKIPILNLEAFRREPLGYDWKALQQAHPDVKVVVRLSRPGVDSLGTFAVVRYEVLTPRGRRWASFTEFAKTPTDVWKFDKAVIGNLWTRARSTPEATLEEASDE